MTCFVCGGAITDGGHAARLIVPGPGLVMACGPGCAADPRFTLAGKLPDDLDYTGRVHQGYGAGLLGEAFPPEMPVGSAWAFGFRHGAVDRRNTLRRDLSAQRQQGRGPMADDPIEFVCQDCGRNVISLGMAAGAAAPDPPRCSVCAWIVEHVPAAEQAAFRERMGVTET